MYWTESEKPEALAVPDDVVDILFALDCRQLPVDHGFALGDALQSALPWLAEVPGLAVHSVHVAGSQNGWERPTHGVENLIQLSRRTKLTVRTPSERAVDLQRDLPGIRLEVGGCPLTVGEGKVRALSRETTLFARYVVGEPGQDEEAFLAATSSTLAALGVRVRKALCGRATALSTPQGPIHTRSLMLADLSLQESFLLQRHGLGHHGLMGCGIFIPHKGVEAVVKDR